jgi:Fur family peroxide stress response transcriptional regulator
MSKALLNEKMTRFRERCRELNLSVTYQRLSIYKALLQLPDHPSPDEIYRVVRRSYPAISLATIYKTLERLEKAGIIAKATLLHETVRFDPRVDHHHHVVCVECKRIEDLDAGALKMQLPREVEAIGLPEAVRRNYDIADYQITFKGVCRACKRKPRPALATATDAGD